MSTKATFKALKAEIAELRKRESVLIGANNAQLRRLAKIAELADKATGTDRTRGDKREPGALGAVVKLLAMYNEALDVLVLGCCRNPRPGCSGATIYCATCTADLATIVQCVAGTITVRRAPPGMYYGRERPALQRLSRMTVQARGPDRRKR